MRLTVKQLIAKLKKCPQDSFVGWIDQDNADGEIAGIVGGVIEFDEEKSVAPDWHKGIKVILRN